MHLVKALNLWIERVGVIIPFSQMKELQGRELGLPKIMQHRDLEGMAEPGAECCCSTPKQHPCHWKVSQQTCCYWIHMKI